MSIALPLSDRIRRWHRISSIGRTVRLRNLRCRRGTVEQIAEHRITASEKVEGECIQEGPGWANDQHQAVDRGEEIPGDGEDNSESGKDGNGHAGEMDQKSEKEQNDSEQERAQQKCDLPENGCADVCGNSQPYLEQNKDGELAGF